jgi:pyruvate dehydrogenase E2 component (dihydrolipoamide acetyltransferase)/2-oxoglutarate dehydrogenase E2 component (dihydrolipoamide succinyltransferase)
MPHEVIMPALGMAQDAGLIVAWHKSPGDAVEADEVLFEVETDKATMEVPAGADGFVTQIRHHAGDEVPVGQVIAVIGDSTEAVHTGETPAGAAAAGAPPKIEGQEVIMPALGMAQESGVIVAWHKGPGDAVKADEVLFEVETDKATMEVAAGHDGYVAALLAEAGEEVPVGDVIAVISAEKPDNPMRTSIRASAAPAVPAPPAASTAGAAPVAVAERKPAAPARPAKKPRAAPTAFGGPILASPKAKRLAAEQGLDLARLAAAGVPMPYHVADLETLRSLPETEHAERAGGGALHVSARVSRSGFAAFVQDVAGRANVSTVLASFAAASLRAAAELSALVVRVDQPLLGRSVLFSDPDLAPMSTLAGASPEDAGPPDLILRDVTGSRVTGGVLGAASVPALTVADEADDYVLSLDFAPGQLDPDAAVRLLDGFAGRLDEPLRHLL